MSGFLKPLLGIGGGVIVVPALVLLARFPQKEAQAASLWYVVPTTLCAAIWYAQDATLDIRFRSVAALVVAGVVGCAVGVRFVRRIRQSQLQRLFGLALMFVAGVMFWRCYAGNIAQIAHRPGLQYLAVAWTGLMAGFLSGLLGIGGGAVVVPTLVLMGAFGQKVAQGMSLMYMVPIAFVGALLYRYHVKVQIEATQGATLIASGIAGAFIGFRLVQVIPPGRLRVVFAIALCLIGVITILCPSRRLSDKAEPDYVI